MLKYKLFLLYVSAKSFFFPLYKDRKENGFEKAKYKVVYKTVLGKDLKESSALANHKLGYLTLNDGGNKPEVFIIDSLGKERNRIDLQHLKSKVLYQSYQ